MIDYSANNNGIVKDKLDSPFFTVVIPTHNRSLLLKRAVDSVLCQTFKKFEIIIVDDNSTDDTAIFVKSFSDPRIRYKLNQRSKGACGARNTGIFSAKGLWVAFLDDDDEWLPEKLRHQFDLIKNTQKSIGLVCADYAIYKGGGKKIKKIKNRPAGWVQKKILFGGFIGCLSSTCVRTDILTEIQGFDERFPASQDQDLWLRVAEVAEFASVPLTLVNMYQEDRERIGKNISSKLKGHIMLRDKFHNLINRDIRLKHRHEAHIFIYASLMKQKKILIKSMPWFLVGVIADFPQCINSYMSAINLLYKNRKMLFSIRQD